MKESHHLHHHHHHQPCQQQQLTSFQDWRGGGSVVVLAQCWPSCMKYLIHGSALVRPPGAANTLQRPPLGHLLRKYGTHCSLNQTFNFGISNRHQSPSQSVMYYKLYGCSGSRRRLKSVQEAVVIRTVNTVVGAGVET